MITLDELFKGADAALSVSRSFAQGGRNQLGLVARPGAPSITDQLRVLSDRFGGRSAVLIDDDVFSGSTLMEAATLLRGAGIDVQEALVGAQVGDELIADLADNLRIRALVRFTQPVANAALVLDTFDPRNYLAGAGGLVVHLPSGAHGRVPYLSPYVSVRLRSTVLGISEEEFALSVLNLNAQFFNEVRETCGWNICLSDQDTAFQRVMAELHGWVSKWPMTEIIRFLHDDLAHWTALLPDGRLSTHHYDEHRLVDEAR